MNRCLIFVASLFLAFVAISSASTASPAEWSRAAPRVAATMAPSESGGGSGVATSSWATVPAPRIFTLVAISL